MRGRGEDRGEYISRAPYRTAWGIKRSRLRRVCPLQRIGISKGTVSGKWSAKRQTIEVVPRDNSRPQDIPEGVFCYGRKNPYMEKKQEEHI